MMNNKKRYAVLAAFFAVASAVTPFGWYINFANAAYHFSNYEGKSPIHIYKASQKIPSGVTPSEIKKIYGLPATGGQGTIAIIDAYDDATIEKDLAVFDTKYELPTCTVVNGCLEKHVMASSTKANSLATLETSLDVEWAHAIAPTAKILLVESKTQSGANLLGAVDYAAARKDVVAVSMSWGGAEFPEEKTLDTHFMSKYGAVFFASSGDSGAGASWPASSPNVVAVGGTSLELTAAGSFISESAWTGSGGGVSAYEPQPAYQASYKIPKAFGMRAIPDVSYDADPRSGFPIYQSSGSSKDGWYMVGGTSAGAPQWAAIEALGGTVSSTRMYADKASIGTLKYFRDITSGANGTCQYYCDARKRYDYVTGLGSPETTQF